MVKGFSFKMCLLVLALVPAGQFRCGFSLYLLSLCLLLQWWGSEMLSGIALILGSQTPSQGWSCWGGAVLGAGQAGTDSGLGASTVLSTSGRQTRLGSW